jgi:hypothetical protein
MMTRTQITLEPELQKTARRRAAQLGVSLAEYVRRLIARDLAEPGPTADASIVLDLGTSGGADVARDKDAMIGEAIAARQSRSSRRRR